MAIKLPDLEYKVKADDRAFEVTAAKAKLLGDGVERSIGPASPAGLAFVTFGERGELAATRISSATSKTRADLDALEARTRSWAAETGRDFEAGTRAVLKLGDEGEIAVSKLSRAVDHLSPSLDKGTESMFDFGRAGIQPMNAVIGLGVALGLVLTPLAAYTVGLAAAITLGSVVVGGLGILGVAVVALAEHYGNWAEASQTLSAAQTNLTKATDAHNLAVRRLKEGEVALHNTRKPTESQLLHLQDLQANVAKTAEELATAQTAVNDAMDGAKNPLTALEGDLDKMAKTLGEQAVPAATQILQWLDNLIPIVQRLGSELIDWFTKRLPSAIPLATQLFQDIVDAAEKLGARLGPIFDDLLAHPETFEKAVKDAFGGTVDAIGWVLTKIQELTKWWSEHGPELEATATKSMRIIADASQALIEVLGTLATKFDQVERAASTYGDTLINKLAPATDGTSNRQSHLSGALDAVSGALAGVAKVAGAPFKAFGDLGQQVASLAGKVLSLTDRLGGAGSTASAVGAVFNWLVGQVAGLAEAGIRAAVPLFGIVDVLTRIFNAAGWAIGAIQNLISWLDKIPGHKSVSIDVSIPAGQAAFGPGGRASGGPVLPGNIYTVGERGPETLVMGRSGGYVIPNGGEVSVSNMASTRRIERLLEAQNQLLSAAIASQPSATFSNRAYGT